MNIDDAKSYLMDNSKPEFHTYIEKRLAGDFAVELAERMLELFNALNDASSGMKYIRETHGDLYGVGFERVEATLKRLTKTI